MANLVEQYFLHGMTKNKEKLEMADAFLAEDYLVCAEDFD